MKHFIGRGKMHWVVVSGRDEVEAVRIIQALFASAEVPLEELEVIEFNPLEEGGILVRNGGEEAARL